MFNYSYFWLGYLILYHTSSFFINPLMLIVNFNTKKIRFLLLSTLNFNPISLRWILETQPQLYISRKERLFTKQLRNKKKRDLSNCFFVEGLKSVLELFKSSYQIKTILSTPRFREDCSKLFEQKNFNWYEVSESVLSSLSTLHKQ